MKNFFTWFITSNSWEGRLLRTIVESVLGFLVSNIDVLFQSFSIPSEWKMIIMGVVVAIVSPILASLRKTIQKEEQTEEQTEE